MLLLFDIDGTLLSGATDAHREALHEALRAVHGVEPTAVGARFSPAGRTDGEIARLILLEAGVSAARIDDRAGAVREACCREYAIRAHEDLRATVLPGVREVLHWLRCRDDVVLGLLTGNYEPVARLKLRQAGIGSFFAPRIGGFGSDSEDRAALPPIARRRAGRGGVPVPRRETIVIGDTPRDIACAHADEVRCIAVATGQFSVEELAGAEATARDAAELREVVDSLLGPD